MEKSLLLIGENPNQKDLDFINSNANNRLIVISINNNLQASINIDYYLGNLNHNLINFCLRQQIKNVITAGKINVKKIFYTDKIIGNYQQSKISEHLYYMFNIHIFSLDNSNAIENINIINNQEMVNIINFKNYIFLYSFEGPNYTCSNTLRTIMKMHRKHKESEYFLKNGLKIITWNNYKGKFNEIFDPNTFDSNEWNNFLCRQKNSVFLFFQLHNYSFSFVNKLDKSNKIVFWNDDNHMFVRTNVAQYLNPATKHTIYPTQYKEKYSIKELNDCNCLITPSTIYFKNLGITEYDNKIKFLFYILNPAEFNQIDINNYKNRQNQIILSGAIGGYKTREDFLNFKLKSSKFNNLIHHLVHPGYKNNEHMTEMKYYNKLSEYKGAFVGHYVYPLNYLLAKHIETLMCGCLGFFERNPLLKEQLGLIEYEHYIPCSDDKGNLIENENFYYDWLEKGEQIAKKGAQYVRNKFGENYIQEYIDIICNI